MNFPSLDKSVELGFRNSHATYESMPSMLDNQSRLILLTIMPLAPSGKHTRIKPLSLCHVDKNYWIPSVIFKMTQTLYIYQCRWN